MRSNRETQGCVLAMKAFVYQHLALYEENKKYPALRIVCQADDTYYGASPTYLYESTAKLRIAVES